jgi:hypothetical protein
MERVGNEWFLEEGDELVIQNVSGEVTDEGHGFEVADCGDADLFYWSPVHERTYETTYHWPDDENKGRLKLKYPADYTE